MEFIGPIAGPRSPESGGDTKKTGKVGLPHGVSLTVFRSLGELNGENRGKNPVNAGENVLEPVVGIEPTTYGLRIHSSIRANFGFDLNLLQVKWGFSSGGVGEPLGDQSTKCYR